jgi:hypothetical protein
MLIIVNKHAKGDNMKLKQDFDKQTIIDIIENDDIVLYGGH